MPIYEYECVNPAPKTGENPVVIELLRSAADADKPVVDPDGKGRVFKRKLSLVTTGGQGAAASGGHVHSSSCGCGKPRGSCGM